MSLSLSKVWTQEQGLPISFSSDSAAPQKQILCSTASDSAQQLQHCDQGQFSKPISMRVNASQPISTRGSPSQGSAHSSEAQLQQEATPPHTQGHSWRTRLRWPVRHTARGSQGHLLPKATFPRPADIEWKQNPIGNSLRCFWDIKLTNFSSIGWSEERAKDWKPVWRLWQYLNVSSKC